MKKDTNPSRISLIILTVYVYQSIYNLYWISSFTQCFWLFWFYSFFLGPTLGPWTRWARNGTSCLTRASPHGGWKVVLGQMRLKILCSGWNMLNHSLIDWDFQFFMCYLYLYRLIDFASSLVSHHPRTCCQQPWCRHQGGRRHVAERSARRCADLGDLRFRHLVVRLKCSFQHRKKLHLVGKFLKHMYTCWIKQFLKSAFPMAIEQLLQQVQCIHRT